MRAYHVLVLCAVFAGSCGHPPAAHPNRELGSLPSVGRHELRPVAAFTAIHDRELRSQALFLEMSRVLLHPRCRNCHPNGDQPLQGMQAALHDPPVTRGAVDMGVVGMQCSSCHQSSNLELSRVPGAPHWQLAPLAAAWVGKTPRAICEQLKDPKRNGGKSLPQLIEHNANDELTGWGWHPGADREPAPGTQQEFAAITRAWIEAGAECPTQEARP